MSPASYRRPGDKGAIGHVKEYWFAYVALAQLIYTFGFTQFNIGDHEKRIAQLEVTQKSEEVVLSEIKTKLASIETSIKYIEQSISKIK